MLTALDFCARGVFVAASFSMFSPAKTSCDHPNAWLAIQILAAFTETYRKTISLGSINMNLMRFSTLLVTAL